MFLVFGLFMSIFCDPCEPTGRLRTIVDSLINRWLPNDTWMLRDRCHDFLNECKSKSHYLPFDDRKTTLKDACNGPIFEDVLSRILNLQKDCGVWMRFGGEAPVFVRREGNRMEVRYGDAKHYTLRKKDPKAEPRNCLAAASCKGVTPYDASLWKCALAMPNTASHETTMACDLVAKARMVHAGLKKQLRKHGLSLEKFDKSHVLLFTNVPTEEAVSPKTFCWSPWTPFVFLNDDAGTANSNAQGVPQESAP